MRLKDKVEEIEIRTSNGEARGPRQQHDSLDYHRT